MLRPTLKTTCGFKGVKGQTINFTESAQSYGINYSFADMSFCMGLSFYDFNKDGLDDISFGGLVGESPRFFQSTGDSTIEQLMPGVSLINDLTRCLLWVDYNNDGYLDISANNHGSHNRFFMNNAGNSFVDVTESAGVDTSDIYSYAGAWGDYDRDGFVDHYSGNRNPNSIFDSRNLLMRNNGNGTFTNVTEATFTVDSQGIAFGVIFLDFDRDGWPDIYVANDKPFTHNSLLKNMGDGTFEDVSDTSSTGKHMDGMGIGVGDFDGNGFEDLYVTNTPFNGSGFGGNILCKNNGDGTFDEVGEQLDLRVFKVGWGSSFADFDNDGDLDLFVCDFAEQNGTPLDRPNKMFVNQGNGTFLEDTTVGFSQVQDNSFGSAVGDINGDGYPDIAVMNEAPENMKLWINNAGTNHWLKIVLEGTVSNRDAIGSWIQVYYGNNIIYRYTRCGTSYGSQDGRATIIGVGEATEIDSVRIIWPNGLNEVQYSLGVDLTYNFVEGGIITSLEREVEQSPEIAIYPNPTTGIIYVDGLQSEANLQVYNSLGAVCLSTTLRPNISLKVSLRELPKGTYLLSIEEYGKAPVFESVIILDE